MILSKLIQLGCFEIFYRFLRRVLAGVGVKGFVEAGYMNLLVQGTNFVMAKSVEGRKNGLLFIFEITNEYGAS